MPSAKPDPLGPEPKEPWRWGLFLLNSVVLIGLLISLDVWLTRSTNWSPKIGLLGVGAGIGTALTLGEAFMKLVDEGRRKQLLEIVERRLIQNAWIWKICLVPLMAVGLLFVNMGTIELVSTESEAQREFRVFRVTSHRSAPSLIDRGLIEPSSTSKYRLSTGLFSSRDYELRIQGLPPIVRTISANQVVRLFVPGSFTGARGTHSRPVLLVVPADWISETAAKNPSILRVHIGGRSFVLSDTYTGQSVWIGGAADLQIPDYVKGQWQTDNPEYRRRLLTPSAVASDEFLKPGQKIRIELLKKPCSPLAPAPSAPPCKAYVDQASQVAAQPAFPQEVVLDGN